MCKKVLIGALLTMLFFRGPAFWRVSLVNCLKRHHQLRHKGYWDSNIVFSFLSHSTGHEQELLTPCWHQKLMSTCLSFITAICQTPRYAACQMSHSAKLISLIELSFIKQTRTSLQNSHQQFRTGQALPQLLWRHLFMALEPQSNVIWNGIDCDPRFSI